MPVLQKKDAEAIKLRFDTELKRDVSLTLFTQPDIGLYVPGRNCPSCGPTQKLLEEVIALSSRLHLEVLDFYKNVEGAAGRRIERIPALIIGSGERDNVRYFGTPAGLEFSVLLDGVIASASRRSTLGLETRRQLKTLAEDVHIQVFVTPTCGYCPSVARLAHAMAMESSRVTADVIEIQEFPDMARAYTVMGVPKIVINDRLAFTGAVSEEVFVQRVLQAVGVDGPDVERQEQVSEQTTLIA